jgi:hypothetical protein
MSKPHDLTGRTFGRLTVVRRADNGHKRIHWECRCTCGQVRVIMGESIKAGRTRSCGCLAMEVQRSVHITHGSYGTPTYTAWRGMLARCLRKNSTQYPHYGGRGITVCERWRDFTNFLADMGGRPKGMTLDRRNNAQGYFKENCRWATKTEQANNKRSTAYVERGGRRQSMSAWARELNFPLSLIRCRRLRGWPDDRLFDPPGTRLKR